MLSTTSPQRNGLWYTIAICLLAVVGLFFAATIVLSLIPVYLTSKNVSVYRATSPRRTLTYNVSDSALSSFAGTNTLPSTALSYIQKSFQTKMDSNPQTAGSKINVLDGTLTKISSTGRKRRQSTTLFFQLTIGYTIQFAVGCNTERCMNVIVAIIADHLLALLDISISSLAQIISDTPSLTTVANGVTTSATTESTALSSGSGQSTASINLPASTTTPTISTGTSTTTNAGVSTTSTASTTGGTGASTASTSGGTDASTASTSGGTGASTASTTGGTGTSTASTTGGTGISTASTSGGTGTSTTGGTDTSTASTTGGTGTSTASTTGGTGISTASTSGGTDTSTASTTGGTGTSTDSTSGGTDTSTASTTDGTGTSTDSTSGGTDTSTASTTGGTGTSTASTTGGTGTSTASTTGGTGISTASTSGGTDTSTASTTGGTGTSTASTTGGTGTSTDSTSGGTDTSTASTTDGTGTSTDSTSGGTDTSTASTTGGTGTSTASTTGGTGTSTASTTGGTGISTASTSGGTDTSTASTTGGTGTSTASTTGGTGISTASTSGGTGTSTTGGTDTSTASTTGGTGTSTASTTGGTGTSTASTTGGTGISTASTSGGTDTSTASTTGGTGTSTASTTGGTETSTTSSPQTATSTSTESSTTISPMNITQTSSTLSTTSSTPPNSNSPSTSSTPPNSNSPTTPTTSTVLPSGPSGSYPAIQTTTTPISSGRRRRYAASFIRTNTHMPVGGCLLIGDDKQAVKSKEYLSDNHAFLKHLPLSIETVPAVDGRKIDLYAYLRRNQISKSAYNELVKQDRIINGHHLTVGALGCLEAHVRAWNRVLEVNQPMLILEDDVQLEKGLYDAVLPYLLYSLPTNFSLLYFGNLVGEEIQLQLIDYSDLLWKINGANWGTYAYLISPHAAATLLDFIYPVTAQIDSMIISIAQSQSLDVFVSKQILVHTDNSFARLSRTQRHLVPPIVIPRILHFIWLSNTSLPSSKKNNIDLWRKYHPEWQIKIWTNETIAADNLDSYNKARLEHSSRSLRQASDIIRYDIIYQYGGVYADVDFEPLKSIEPLLHGVEAFVVHENEYFICNGLFGAIPGHELTERLITQLESNWKKTENSTVNEQSGPYFITKQVEEMRSENKTNMENGFQIFAPHLFFPYAWYESDPGHPYDEHAYAAHHFRSFAEIERDAQQRT